MTLLDVDMDKADMREALDGVFEGYMDGSTDWADEDSELPWEFLEKLRKAVNKA